MREPHWHPRTAEMGYVVKGRARMTVLSPGAKVDTYELGPGDMYFIPRAYPITLRTSVLKKFIF